VVCESGNRVSGYFDGSLHSCTLVEHVRRPWHRTESLLLQSMHRWLPFSAMMASRIFLAAGVHDDIMAISDQAN